MHQVINYCYKHSTFDKGMRGPVEYTKTLDFETGTLSGDCPTCRKELAEQSVTTISNIDSDVKYVVVSVSTAASRKRDKTRELNEKIQRLYGKPF